MSTADVQKHCPGGLLSEINSSSFSFSSNLLSPCGPSLSSQSTENARCSRMNSAVHHILNLLPSVGSQFCRRSWPPGFIPFTPASLNHEVHVLCHFSHVRLFANPWTVACQAPLSMEFSRQEYWSGLPFPLPEDLSDPGIEPASLTSPALAGRLFTTSATREAHSLATGHVLVLS